MDFFQALDVMFEDLNFLYFIVSVTFSVLVYILVFKSYVVSFLDPLTYVLAFSSVALALLLILYNLNIVGLSKVVWTIGVLILFYGAFLIGESVWGWRRVRLINHRPHVQRLDSGFMMMLFGVNLLLWIITYAFFGVPLFLESRLEQFSGGGGVGLIYRLTSGLEFITLMMAMMGVRRGGSVRFWALWLLGLAMVTSLLSGSKSALMNFVFAYYLSEVYAQRRFDVVINITKRQKLMISAVLVSPVLVLGVKSAAGLGPEMGVLAMLVTRIIAEGDGFVYFYGGDLIDDIARFDWFALFRPFLTTLRIVPVETAVNPGYEVITAVLGVDSPAAGPNSRLPIYLYFFYGYFGLILAPIFGFLLSVVRRSLRFGLTQPPIAFSYLASLYFLATKIEVDPQITLQGLVNLMLVSPILIGAIYFGVWLRRPVGDRPPMSGVDK